jgi:hypothetical protein
MKFSKKTLEILNSLKNINPSIYFDGTNKVAVKDVTRVGGQDITNNSVLAVAEIEEEVPEFAIYDSKQFLDCIAVFKDHDLEFSEKLITIKDSEKNASIKYIGCNKELLSIPKKKQIDFDEVVVSFLVEKGVFQELNKVGNFLKNDSIKIEGTDNITISLFRKEEGGSVYTKTFEKTPKENFTVFSNLKNLQILSDDYNVSVCKLVNIYVMFLESINNNLKYYVTLQDEIV